MEDVQGLKNTAIVHGDFVNAYASDNYFKLIEDDNEYEVKNNYFVDRIYEVDREYYYNYCPGLI